MNPSRGSQAPELLHESLISQEVGSYWRVKVIDEIESTQIALAAAQPEDGELLVAEYQSAGRGRLDRTFITERSTALTFSFYIEPTRTRSDWGYLPLLAGECLVRTLNQLTSSDKFQSKWPNDTMVNDQKVSGLLCEVHRDGIIVGIGINVTTAEANLPVPTATSIVAATGIHLNRNVLLAKFLQNFESEFASWNSGKDLRDRYRQTNATLGSEVKISDPLGEERTGRAIDIDSTGALILSDNTRVTVGDITHLRPGG